MDRATPSGGLPLTEIERENNIFLHMNQQIEKSIKRATAKLEVLKTHTTTLAAVVKHNDSLFVNDRIVEQQLLYKQIEEMNKHSKHRQKLDLLPINFMGLVTKILTKSDNEYHSEGAKAAIDKEISKLVLAGVWNIKPISKREAERTFSDATFSRIF